MVIACRRYLHAPYTRYVHGSSIIEAINAAVITGGWVLLQNCELGMDLMAVVTEFLKAIPKRHDDFRLFFTAMPSTEFPLSLVQLCTKVTNEPPAGFRAGLLRSYAVIVDQDRLDKIEQMKRES